MLSSENIELILTWVGVTYLLLWWLNILGLRPKAHTVGVAYMLMWTSGRGHVTPVDQWGRISLNRQFYTENGLF